jgi:hypothetical protein
LRPYIGQSRSLDSFERRRADHFRNSPDGDLGFETIDGAHPGVDLDRVEEHHIREFKLFLEPGIPVSSIGSRDEEIADEQRRAQEHRDGQEPPSGGTP